MLILAFESSAKAASVALVRDDELVAQSTQCSALTHSCTLLPMAEDMLKNCNIRLDEVDMFACAHGPGSFTGIRIGVATVKGMAWAAEKPCIGVSTLEAMAWHGVAVGGVICPVMDARRSQVYNALFEIRDGIPVRLTPDRAISLEELANDVSGLQVPVTLVGDGCVITSAFFREKGIAFSLLPSNLSFQSAWGVAMATKGKPAGDSASLLPVYLRLSQAERERQARLAAAEK